mmetsp:Transcript_10371/g.43553  ORF Transcript_10371/g.43553 Transcript_10371/m.43553 type:complete len:493 (-) Transcript_10371:51-1529(-)
MGGLASRFASSGTCSSAQTRFRRATCAVLRAGGPTPKHVAIVMDGNRRFAKSRSIHRARGHEHGADKLVDVLEWCLALGVEVLSVYAFSTDNLKRDAEEKAGLFALAEARLLEIAASDVIREKKVRVRVVGDVFREANEIPESLRVAAAKVTAMTWHHSGPVLNVCFAYTGREDIAQAVGALGAAKNARVVAYADVTADALERCLRGAAFDAAQRQTVFGHKQNGESPEEEVFETDTPSVCSFDMNGKGKGDRVVRRTALDDVARLAMPILDTDDESDVFSDDDDDEFRSTRKTRSSSQTSGVFGDSSKSFRAPRVPNVDLLIRTSGETRLSDFILWGVSKHAVLCFLEVLWPDFSFTDMCHAVWTYQISAGHARRGRRRFREAEAREGENKEVGDPNDTRSDLFRSDLPPRGVSAAPRRRLAKKIKSGSPESETTDFVSRKNSDVSVAWVDVGKATGAGTGAGTGAAFAFVAERNRKIVEETARRAGVAAT